MTVLSVVSGWTSIIKPASNQCVEHNDHLWNWTVLMADQKPLRAHSWTHKCVLFVLFVNQYSLMRRKRFRVFSMKKWARVDCRLKITHNTITKKDEMTKTITDQIMTEKQIFVLICLFRCRANLTAHQNKQK